VVCAKLFKVHGVKNKTTLPMSDLTTDDTAKLISEIFRQCLSDPQALRDCPAGLSQPALVVQLAGSAIFGRVLRANAAWLDMTGYAAADVQNVRMPQLEAEADGSSRESLQERLDQAGYAVVTREVLKKDGTYLRVESTVVRVPAWAELDAEGEVLIVIDRRLESLVAPAGGAEVSQSQRIALRMETLLRRYIRENYRQGMHPAQWSALRYFKLAPPEARSLTGFAKAHHTTMGTASTTVSTLVGKGYLQKHSFRGAVNLTKEGEALMRHDPLTSVVTMLNRMSAFERDWAEYVLTALSDSFGHDDER
jgi:PAS domain S-box-containing protein